MTRGFWGSGVCNGKTPSNMGTLWRTAHNYGAAFVFTVGRRYHRQASDTTKAWRHVPCYHYGDLDDLVSHLPMSCPLVGVEIDAMAVDLRDFKHPEAACYLLGAEDHGLTEEQRRRCHHLVVVPGAPLCLNVAVSGSIVAYDRWQQFNERSGGGKAKA